MKRPVGKSDCLFEAHFSDSALFLFRFRLLVPVEIVVHQMRRAVSASSTACLVGSPENTDGKRQNNR